MSALHHLRRALVRSTLLIPMLLLGLACDDPTAGGTVTPGGRGGDSELDPEGEQEGESMGELDLRLDRLTAQQTKLIQASHEDPGTCEDLCELSRAICEVKTKMCTIAEERVADDEYQDLCRKAKQRCREASDSCVRCVEQHEGTRSGEDEPEPDACGAVEASPE